MAQWLLEHPHQDWNNQYLIYVKCDIEKYVSLLKYEDVSYFLEPDLNNQLTAMAIQMTDSNKRILKKLRLFK